MPLIANQPTEILRMGIHKTFLSQPVNAVTPPPSIIPSGLTFSVVSGPTRAVDQFSDRFQFTVPDAFAGGVPANTYTDYVLSGTSTVTYGSGTAAFTGASAGGVGKRFGTAPIAPYCWAEMTVSARSGTSTPFVGFAKDTSNYLWIYVLAGSLGIDGKIGGVAITTTNQTLTVSVPFTIRLVVCYPEAWLWLSDTNGNRPLKNVTLSGADLRLLANWSSSWRPLFGFDRSAGASGTCTSFRTGYTGGVGLRDFKPVTYADGRPYVSGTKRYFMATCATGDDFKTNHTSVLSVDLANSYALKIESLLFFNIANSDRANPAATKDMRTSLYGGQILRDVTDTKWLILTNGWGLGNVSTGVQLWYAETTSDVLNVGGSNPVLAIDAYQRTMYDGSGVAITNGLYDNAQYYESATGKWRTVCAEANAASGWSTFNGDLFEGTALDNQWRVAQDTTHQAEGLNWCRIGGAWFATSGGTGGAHCWNASLTYQYSLASNIDHTGVTFSFSSFGTHFPVVAILTAPNTTQYLAMMFDDSLLLTKNATKGAAFIETSQSVTGVEWP